MSHLIDFLISAVVVMLALFAFAWLASNPSSPLVGKI